SQVRVAAELLRVRLGPSYPRARKSGQPHPGAPLVDNTGSNPQRDLANRRVSLTSLPDSPTLRGARPRRVTNSDANLRLPNIEERRAGAPQLGGDRVSFS